MPITFFLNRVSASSHLSQAGSGSSFGLEWILTTLPKNFPVRSVISIIDRGCPELSSILVHLPAIWEKALKLNWSKAIIKKMRIVYFGLQISNYKLFVITTEIQKSEILNLQSAICN